MPGPESGHFGVKARTPANPSKPPNNRCCASVRQPHLQCGSLSSTTAISTTTAALTVDLGICASFLRNRMTEFSLHSPNSAQVKSGRGKRVACGAGDPSLRLKSGCAQDDASGKVGSRPSNPIWKAWNVSLPAGASLLQFRVHCVE